MSNFILENQVYEFLKTAGLTVPRYHLLKNENDIQSIPFKQNENLVMKGLALDLWHKSDFGCVQFCQMDQKIIHNLLQKMTTSLSSQFRWQHAMLVEKIDFQKINGLPTEVFVSLKKDVSCGWILLWGIGGVQSEFWAQQIPPQIINLNTLSFVKTFEMIKNHFISKVLLGEMRGATPLITPDQLQKWVQALYLLPTLLDDHNLNLLEINPFVINREGQPLPLDGVGVRNPVSKSTMQPAVNVHKFSHHKALKLFEPQKIGILGVSKRPDAPTNIILENAKASFSEVVVVKDPSSLKTDPVDLLIVGINPKNTYEFILQLLEQGSGAEYLYLVTGGINDGSDHEHLGAKIISALTERRKNHLWTPSIIGPNGLGMISKPKQLNTLFIPKDKLPIDFQIEKTSKSTSEIAIISQSGAFMITRLNKYAQLNPKYAISIGSKMDLKIFDFLKMLDEDPSVKTVGLYVEGFDPNEALATAQVMRDSPKKFVIYKGGRSASGAKAAQSHTGAMMTDYGLLKATFKLDNVELTDSFSEWNSKLIGHRLQTPQKQNNNSPLSPNTQPKLWGLITNAGYESVGSGDFAMIPQRELDPSVKSQLEFVIHKHQLQSLVSAANPMDLTPMASEQVWLDCVEVFLKSDIDILFLGLVPLTPRLNTADPEKMKVFAKGLATLRDQFIKNVNVIIDAGADYHEFRSAFMNEGFPVYESVEDALKIF